MADKYHAIRAVYKIEITQAMDEYLLSPEGTRVTKTRNRYSRAINEAFWDAFEEGYQAAGAEMPLDQPAFDWVLAKVPEEFGHAAQLFDRLRTEVKPKADNNEFMAELMERSEGYALTLDGVYGMGKVFGSKNKALTFIGPDGKESCKTCMSLKGKRHSGKWWIKNGLVPYPGNPNYICGKWQCQHYLVDDTGQMVTL